MNRVFLLLLGVTVLGSAYVIAPVVTDTYRRYRGRKIVVCPETGQIADVELKAKRASLFSAFGREWVRIRSCSLWPKRKGCAEDCLKNLCDRRAGNHGE
jgi:hypothetical protein